MKLAGIFVPLVTPFNHQGGVYRVKVRANVEQWNRTSLAGYAVCAWTGEGPLLSLEEKTQVWQWVAESSASGRLLMAGTSAEGVRETLEEIQRAAAAGYQAALVSAPRCFPRLSGTPETQMLYFRAVADRSPLPVVISCRPAETGVRMDAETLQALAEHPNIVGIEEGSGDTALLEKLVKGCPKGFALLTGTIENFWPALQAGAAGGVLDLANAAPYAAVTIWEAHRMREREAAEDWQQRVAPAARLIREKYGVAGLKYALDLNGFYGGPPRLPFTPVDSAAQAEIAGIFRELRS